MSEELEKLKKLENQLTLIRDDFAGYSEFVERNIRQSKRIIQLQNQLDEIRMRATRHERATQESKYLLGDLDAIRELCDKVKK